MSTKKKSFQIGDLIRHKDNPDWNYYQTNKNNIGIIISADQLDGIEYFSIYWLIKGYASWGSISKDVVLASVKDYYEIVS